VIYARVSSDKQKEEHNNDRRVMHADERVRHGDKATSRLAPKGDDGHFDLCVAVNARNDWLDLE
jgi:hypothetical protein